MPIQVQTSLMIGGLDLVTPPISMPPGKAIAASNYAPDVAGYTRMGGYEAFDGRSRPSDSTDPVEIAARRAAIGEVPGTGPVRGVWVYDGSVYAFRDQTVNAGQAGKYKATTGGWVQQTFGYLLNFTAGASEFLVGEYVADGTSGATALINRVVLRSGAWDGTAEGFLVVSSITGTFGAHAISSSSGAATGTATEAITMLGGGKYDFTNHNFYGSAARTRMYFVNGADTGYEWDGSTLTPIHTGITGGTPTSVSYLLGYYRVLTVTMTIATPCVVTLAEPVGSPYTVHGLSADQPILFETTGALPTGVTAGTTYYVLAAGLTTTTFRFSATVGGAAVNTSGSQSGTHCVADSTTGPFLLAYDGSSLVMSASGFDAPTFISHYKNHLFLGYSNGALLNSSLGEPLEFITTTGAGEISFGDQITGLLTAASTSLVIFAQNRIEYITGNDATSFVMQPISDASGAKAYTVAMMDSPMFLDDGGIRSLPTTASFGDWRMAAVSQAVEPLMLAKRDAGVTAVAAMRIKAKDQYRLFWDDGTGVTVYIGRKYPETMTFKLPVEVFCACSGEVDVGLGDRLFIGCEDGFVYEMDRGTSYNGAAIDSYIRLPFTAAKSPMQDTRWTKATFEIAAPDDVTIGVAFDVDYARGLGGSSTNVDVDAGTAIITADNYAEVDWTQPVEGRLEYHLSGIGPNIAATLIHSSATTRAHTISTQTYNFSRRKLRR